MKLFVDVGNTAMKWRFRHGEKVEQGGCRHGRDWPAVVDALLQGSDRDGSLDLTFGPGCANRILTRGQGFKETINPLEPCLHGEGLALGFFDLGWTTDLGRKQACHPFGTPSAPKPATCGASLVTPRPPPP